MANTSGNYASPNPSIINTTPNPVYFPLSPVIPRKVNAATARYTASGNSQCFHMDFSAPSHTSTLYRLDEAMEVIPASPTRSGESSGIGGSAGLFECLPGVVESSLPVSTTSSLNSECRHVQSIHIPACSDRSGTPRADESNRTGFMTSDNNNHFCSNPLPNGSPPDLPIRNLRHQSLPTDSPIPISAKYNGSRRQSSPGAQRIGEPFSSPLSPTLPVTASTAAATTARNTSLTSSFNKLNIRSRCRGTNGVVVDMLARSVPGTVHAMPSSLEPIPQGQELLVNTAGLSGPISPTSPGGNVGARQPCKRVSDPAQSNGSGTRRKVSPCCACHFVSETLLHVEARVHLEAADARAAYASRLYKFNHSSVEEDPPECERDAANGKSDSRNSVKHGAQWARDLLGRLRSNSTHLNTDQADLRTATPNGRKHVAVRPGDPNRSIETLPNGSNLPDTIDPRRLPKIHGPASACLQFSKKPLNSPVINHTLPSSSQPIPMLSIHGSHISPVLKASSWRHRKQLHRVRWLSQSHGEESGCESSDGFFGTASGCARLSCSAVEEFQGAVDILAATNRQQVFASSVCSARAGVRIRRASESERLLVISKSHSDSKEESISCSFGQFDEDHVFSTLFRHSTCYDVLPDSGKLVMVDSRLGAVRAIRVLLENGVQAAPIWHAPTHSVTGLFSQELALHLLASLYSSITLADSSNQDTVLGDSGTQAKSPAAHNNQLTDGLRMWGTRRLCEVLRVFHTEHDHGMCLLDPFDVDVIVSPQTRLRKALSRLLHRKSKLNSYASPQHSAFPDALSQRSQQPVQHHSVDCNSDAAECCFAMDEANSSNGMKHHQPLQQVASTPVSVRSLSDSTKASSHFPIAANDIFSPTHLMVMDPTSGNVLGVLGPDRLLAYLRLRLDELPYSTQMLSPVDSIPGLRWSERSWSLRHCRIKHNSSDPHPAADVNANLPSPILSPSSLCGDTIRALSIWLPQLPALPVICSNEGATTQTNPLLGFISPGDLLHFVLGHSPDQAVHQPVSKILEAKLMHCRFHQDCICYTNELIADALDRTFRLKAPCLVLFDAPKHGSPAGTGNPVGVVTSKDLLRAIVTSKSSRPDSGVAGMSHTNHERCDSPLGDHHWAGGSLSSDEVMSSNSFERNARKPEAIHHSDSLLGASNSSFDDGASLSSSSGSTCSAHSDSERLHLTSRLHHPIPSDGSFCNCACHQSMDGKNPLNGKTEQPRFLSSHQMSTDSTFSYSSKGSEGPPTRTTNACTMDTKLPSPDAPTQFHPTVQQRSIRTPNTSTFDPVGTHSTPRAPGSALPTRGATVYPVTGLAPDSNEKKHVKRGDEEEAVFPMD